MSWNDLPNDMYKIILNRLSPSDQANLRRTSKNISKLPIDLSHCCLPPNTKEIITYILSQTCNPQNIISSFHFVNSNGTIIGIIIDSYMNGIIQRNDGSVINPNELANYLRGYKLTVLNDFDKESVRSMLKVILRARFQCLEQQDFCFTTLLNYYDINPIPPPEVDLSPSHYDDHRSIDYNVTDEYVFGDKVGVRKYLNIINVNYDDGYLLLKASERGDIAMVVALLNRKVSEGLMDALAAAGREEKSEVVRALLNHGMKYESLRGSSVYKFIQHLDLS